MSEYSEEEMKLTESQKIKECLISTILIKVLMEPDVPADNKKSLVQHWTKVCDLRYVEEPKVYSEHLNKAFDYFLKETINGPFGKIHGLQHITK